MISFELDGNRVQEITHILENNRFEIRYNREMGENARVILIHFFKLRTFSEMWKTLEVLYDYDDRKGRTVVDILNPMIWKNLVGMEFYGSSHENDEIEIKNVILKGLNENKKRR